MSPVRPLAPPFFVSRNIQAWRGWTQAGLEAKVGGTMEET